MNFVEMVKKGLCSIDEIDNYIDKWHDEYTGNLELYEFLGMTENEYEQWLINPSSLKTMFVKNHSKEPAYASKKIDRIAKKIIKKVK